MEETFDQKLQRIKKELAAQKAKEDQGSVGRPHVYVPRVPFGQEENEIYKKVVPKK